MQIYCGCWLVNGYLHHGPSRVEGFSVKVQTVAWDRV